MFRVVTTNAAGRKPTPPIPTACFVFSLISEYPSRTTSTRPCRKRCAVSSGEGGVADPAALADHRGGNHPTVWTEDLQAALRECLRQPPDRFGYQAVCWTVGLLQQQLAPLCEDGLSTRTIRRQLDDLGYVWKRPRYVLDPDPERDKKTAHRPRLGAPGRAVANRSALAAQALSGVERDGSSVGPWERPPIGQQAIRRDRGAGQRLRRVLARVIEPGCLAPGRYPIRGLLVARRCVKFQLSTRLGLKQANDVWPRCSFAKVC